jgi:beta-galactosidase
LADDEIVNGAYEGVSWWWRKVHIPAHFEGKKIILHLRGARLRAEVYLNGELVGYNIITETSFECDLSQAAKTGKDNLLAIRITNPGGRYDWLDVQTMQWGDVRFNKSYGMGGLDRGLSITAHDPVYLSDLYVLNRPEITTLDAYAEIVNTSADMITGVLLFEIMDNGKPIKSIDKDIEINPGDSLNVKETIELPGGELWSKENPKLYQIRARVITENGGTEWSDDESTNFGLRWFNAENIGSNAILTYNGERIRIYSAISWGFWGFNGLWPSPGLARKEVEQARKLGFNTLSFHRKVARTDVLKAQDSLGLYRYMEPGGGVTAFIEGAKGMGEKSTTGDIDPSGGDGQPRSFAEQYMEEKIKGMVRDHRGHTSLLMYAIQNEISVNLHNPRIFHIIRLIHRMDPSRPVILKSGIPPNNQVWMKPYEDSVRFDDGTSYSGWWTQHTVGGPAIWMDDFYQGPEEFTHRADNYREVTMWGEMFGASSTDNHQLMVSQIENSPSGSSYDLQDHKEVLGAYDAFLDKWGFRKAFPQSSDLFLDIGNKVYDFFGRVIETARLDESNDMLVISGWESTSIHLHCGMVDNLRNLKGANPEWLARGYQKLRPVFKARHIVKEAGSQLIADIYLLNETNQSANGRLKLQITAPDGKVFVEEGFDVPVWEQGRFVYLAKEAWESPELDQEGYYQVELRLEGDNKAISNEKILVLHSRKAIDKDTKIGILTNDGRFIAGFNRSFEANAERYTPENDYDLLIMAYEQGKGRSYYFNESDIKNTKDLKLYQSLSFGTGSEPMRLEFAKLPPGEAKLRFHFYPETGDYAGRRVFDILANNKVVLENIDFVAETGRADKPLVKEAKYTIPEDGQIAITINNKVQEVGYINALEIICPDTLVRVNCGGGEYQAHDGKMWYAYHAPLPQEVDQSVIEKIRAGTDLLVISQGGESLHASAEFLSRTGAFDFKEMVGGARRSSFGSWYFVRKHPVYDGLPVDQAMKSYYQVPALQTSNGIILDGNTIDVFAGYGRDHSRRVGAASFTCPLDKGNIVFHTLPGLIPACYDVQTGIHPVVGRRLIWNSMGYLMKQ